ncbi:hypothetical protein BIFGAL_03854 [Bifidobacterium gallicum DSM 20093 = LMG 11596]|uniref:Uncharacterized protein n=1 Tax=Bifidobacterium gallicum DSM 20093 = LMG 11596 TaxID=561180 RepID=D1NVG5_9BIFI|nr:hypothetical protein BIFGAL_03854 [Bifidobacterium gallicum DSM 20093 = LMG 11596]
MNYKAWQHRMRWRRVDAYVWVCREITMQSSSATTAEWQMQAQRIPANMSGTQAL